jgi:glutamate synthase domain-containing protein 3
MTGVEIALIAGIAISAAGALSAGAAAKRKGDYDEAVGKVNAKVIRRDAAENARRQERINRKHISTYRNAETVSLDLLEDNIREAKLMELDTIHRGEVRALGAEAGAGLAKMQGEAGQQAGYFSAAGSLLKGAGSVGGSSSFSGTPSATGYDNTGQTLASGSYGW